MRFRHIFSLFGALALFATSPALAEKPLVQEGKKTVFERVISHPNAKLYADATATREISSPRTFTAFYVYAAEGNMLRVGVSASKSDGWLKLDETTRWPTAVTMEFTNQMGRKPVLFFRDHAAILDLCSSESLPQTVDQYVTLFSSPNSRKPANLPVIAAEPSSSQGQVSQENFYLMPVLNVDNQLYETHGTKLINVACVDSGVLKNDKNGHSVASAKNSLPQINSAWISDSDLTSLVQNEGMDPVPAANPAVLLTKMQLSQLRKQIQEVIHTIEEAFLTGKQVDIYDQLISAVARISVDPTGFSHAPDESLIKKGVLLEVLGGLPYRSVLLNYTHEDWIALPQNELIKIISRCKSLVRRYEEYDRDDSYWNSFDSPNPNNWVCLLPMSLLP